MRALFGLERVPRSLAADDPRLPAVELGPEMLRMNAIPLPVEAWGGDVGSHAGRRAAYTAWLVAQAGDYNAALRRALLRYLDAIDEALLAAEAELAMDLARFDGLFQRQDRFWSAPRPLVRAWWREGDAWLGADVAVWDGVAITALSAAQINAAEDVLGLLPERCAGFWREVGLPVSPFRRVLETAIQN